MQPECHNPPTDDVAGLFLQQIKIFYRKGRQIEEQVETKQPEVRDFSLTGEQGRRDFFSEKKQQEQCDRDAAKNKKTIENKRFAVVAVEIGVNGRHSHQQAVDPEKRQRRPDIKQHLVGSDVGSAEATFGQQNTGQNDRSDAHDLENLQRARCGE